MSAAKNNTGRCLCGSVRFSVHNMGDQVGACHCKMCRRWGGGPFMEVDCGANIVFEGEENISRFSSSEWAERGFCRQCGSHLFYRLKDNNQHMVPVGLLDSDQGLQFSSQVFIDEKPLYYSFSNETEKLTGAELFAKFAPPSS